MSETPLPVSRRAGTRLGGPESITTVGPPPLVLRLASVLVIPLVLYALYATGQKALDHHRMNMQAEELRREVTRLREENIQLQREILLARSDTAIEASAREHLGLVKPGDQALILLPPPGQEVPRTPRPLAPLNSGGAVTGEATPPWQQWRELFFGSLHAGP